MKIQKLNKKQQHKTKSKVQILFWNGTLGEVYAYEPLLHLSVNLLATQTFMYFLGV